MNNNICSICLDSIDDSNENYELRCGHTFHTKCIIRWFREGYVNGKCPLCLDNPSKKSHIGIKYYGFNFNSKIIDARCSSLKKYNKKNKDKNIKLNSHLTKLKILEKDLKILKNDIKIFHNEGNYKKIKKKSKELSKNLRNKNSQINNLKCKIFSNCPTLMI
tara:strand:+ start:1111 stop:1596 length:486 start_codon:yes stop_codon:yes gene_type:complete